MRSPVLAAKVLVAARLSTPSIGRLAGWVFRDRIPNRGCVIDVSDPCVAPWVKASLLFGFYESAEIRFAQRYIPPGMDVVELGGGLGVVSAHVARKLEPGRRLVCVEANRALLPALERNVRLNAPHVSLSMLCGAIDYSSDARDAAFLASPQNIYSRLAGDDEVAQSVSVPRVSLDDVLRRHEIGDYVLVSDIEGAEAGLVQAEERALRRCRLVIAELHATRLRGREVTVEDLVAGLTRLGFAVADRHGPVCVFARRG